jgi:hypothetical protein
MTTGKRIALLVAVVVIAAVGFVIAKPNDGSEKDTPAPQDSAAQTTPTTGGQADQPEEPARPEPPPVPQVRVKGGQPVGGVKKISVDKGERVRFVVVSDVADHVHVHGYDLMKDVEPGTKANFSFPAKIDGVFEVELEDRAVQIAELEVQP